MKKTLLLLVALFTAVMAHAVDATALANLAEGSPVTVDGYTFTVSKGEGKTNPTFNATNGDYRLYALNTLTVATADGSGIQTMVFTLSAQGKRRMTEVTASTGEVSIDMDAGTFSWTAPATSVVSSVTFTVGEKATYGSDGADKAGQFDFSAVTFNGEVTPVDPQPSDPTEYTIAQLNTLTNNVPNVLVKFNNAQVVYTQYVEKNEVSSQNIFIREGDKAVQFYNVQGVDIPEYAVLSGSLNVDFKSYYGIPEIVENASTDQNTLELGEGAEPTPTEATVAEVIALQHLCDLIILRGVTVEQDGNNYYAVDAEGNRVQLYGGIDVAEYAGDGNTYDVVAVFNNIYKGAAEVLPVSLAAAGKAPVVAPKFSPAAGTYTGSVTVTLSAGANSTIYYTIDGSDPADENNPAALLYEAPFTLTETAEVKAVAEDVTGELSEVASARYIIEAVPEEGLALPFEETFETDLGSFTAEGTFTVAGAEAGEVKEYAVWYGREFNGDVMAYASSYNGGQNYDAEGWLISPKLDLTKAEKPVLTFTHAINKYFNDPATEATVWVREVSATATWQQMQFAHPATPEKTWSATEDVTIDLAAFVGKSIEVGFRYIGTANGAGSWEILKVAVKEDGGDVPPGPGPEPVEGQETSFDFVANTYGITPSTSEAQDQGNITETLVNEDGVSISFQSQETDKAKPRLWQGNNFVDLRFYNGQTMNITAPKPFKQITFYGNAKGSISLQDMEGNDVKDNGVNGTRARAPKEEVSKVSAVWQPSWATDFMEFTATATNKITEIVFVLDSATGIESVSSINIDNKAYDLSGRRVQNLQQGGIYIVNGKKVLVK